MDEQEDTVFGPVRALMAAEPEMATGFLMAAVYCLALRERKAPRDIIENLWKAMPDRETWPSLRTALEEMLGEPDPPA